MTKLEKIYKKTSTGKIQVWEIIVNGNQYWTISGQLNGKQTQSKPTKCIGKNVGKANATSDEEQALKEAQAKRRVKLEGEYKESIDDVNTPSYFVGMKAANFEDYKDNIVYPVAVEDKLNGICCIGTQARLHSYKGKSFYCVEHIADALRDIFEKNPNLILHGELFNKEYKNLLNRISSLVSVNRKPKDITEEDRSESKKIIKYYVYDCFGGTITKETPFVVRKQYLKELLKDIPFVEIHDYTFAKNEAEVRAALAKTRADKDEGIMVKLLDGVYEQKRSQNILKLKNWMDREYKILDFIEGTGNWAGCVKKVVCELDPPATNGKTTFESNIRGDMPVLSQLLIDKDLHIGKLATVDFQELSEFGIPLIPYCSLPFRDYE